MTQSRSDLDPKPNELGQILVRIQSAQGHLNHKPSLVVFDLDSTLFDVGPRLDQILADYAKAPEHQRLFPKQIPLVEKARVHRKDWGFVEALVRAGFDGDHPEFEESIRRFWLKTFFSNEYLHFDKPYPGAVEYCQSLASAGARISYLTGRDVSRMGPGSHEVLRKWNFPLQDQLHELILKPHKEMDDAEFKRDWFADLDRTQYSEIYFFENEPVNIHLIRKTLPHIQVIFFDSTHSRQAQAPEDIPRIEHFLFDQIGES